MASFTDWRTRWANYLSLARVMDGIETLTARQGLLRCALHPDWTVLWQTGRLDVQADDDIDAIVPKLERYLRSRRNPLLNRQGFFSRAKGEHGNIDHLVAALVVLHQRCAFDDDAKGRCVTVNTTSGRRGDVSQCLSCLHRSDSSCVRCSFMLRSLSAHARHRSFFLTLFAHRNVGLSCAVMGARSVW